MYTYLHMHNLASVKPNIYSCICILNRSESILRIHDLCFVSSGIRDSFESVVIAVCIDKRGRDN